MIAIVDYGAGNLFSVKNALDFLKVPCVISGNEVELQKADAVILPGVGAFPDAVRQLRDAGLFDALKALAIRKPFLGICLGMQLLFEYGMEFEKTEGLALIPGGVVPIETTLKVPHMGYNELYMNMPSPLMQGIREGDCVYFVHSFMADTAPLNVCAYVDYEVKIPALVQKGQVFGTQFHPEKSGTVGLTILQNFADLTM